MVDLTVIASGDPLDIRTWSGTPFHMVKTLQGRYPDLLAIRTPRPRWIAPARRVVAKLTAGHVDLYWSRSLAHRHAAKIARDQRGRRAGVALCIANAPLSAHLADHMPTIHVSDATAVLMQNYYREFSNLHHRLAVNARLLDEASVRRSAACIFPTEWAARSAIEDYGAEPSRVHVIPYGANVDPAEDAGIGSGDSGCCHLVFIGMDWQRKGGDIAIAAVQALRHRGVPAQLDIIGANPPIPAGAHAIHVHGRINKSTEAGRSHFDAIMRRADFMLVPTRQDCYGLFAAEANAFGIPVISTRTGGLPGIVTDGVNGYLLPVEARGGDYADVIANVWADDVRYMALRRGARGRFTASLNWNSWLKDAADIIDDVGTRRARG